MLLVWDTPTSSLSAGWTRYTLERRYGQPVTAVRTASLARANFADFDVIVLPSGNYGGSINDAVLNRIKDWLRAGGTLVTLAEATRWATGANVGLLSTTGLLKDGRPDTPVHRVHRVHRVRRVRRVRQVRAAVVTRVRASRRSSITTRRFSRIVSGRRRSRGRFFGCCSTPTIG